MDIYATVHFTPHIPIYVYRRDSTKNHKTCVPLTFTTFDSIFLLNFSEESSV